MIDYAARLGIQPTGTNADPKLMIDWFDYFGGDDEPKNGYRFLSNFYVEPFKLSLRVGKTLWKPREFITGEHAFQAAKATNAKDFNAIADAKTPSQAKALGRSCQLRPDWEVEKLDVMRQVLDAKFSMESDCIATDWLLATGDALLVEGTWWHDVVWGVDLNTEGTPGRNLLGVLLMARRAELRALLS